MKEIKIYDELFPKANKEEVYRLLGYRKGKTILAPDVEKLIDDVILEAQELIKPVAITKTFVIGEKNQKHISTETGCFQIHSSSIAKLLDSSKYITLMVVTIGETIEKKVDSYFQGDEYTKAFTLDAVASVLAEETMELLNTEVTLQAKKLGYGTTKRFSPGYGDWELTAQQSILENACADKIGVTANEASLLIPRKTVSAILGWEEIKKQQVQSGICWLTKCNLCDKLDCSYRKIY